MTNAQIPLRAVAALTFALALAACSPPADVPAATDSCDDTPNGGMDSRVRYEAAFAPYGQECLAETQTRLCDAGTWSAWTGTFALGACTVDAARSCDGIAHGGMESRVRYEATSVSFGATCAQETQTRSCDDGAWSAWSGGFSAESCSVSGPASCGTTPDGGMESRVRYASASAPFGGACMAETQTRTCQAGAWSEWSGNFASEGCSVAGGQSCDGIPHGGQQSRTRYDSALAPFGAQCHAETQARTCNDGTWSEWSGTFTVEACSVAAPLSCEDTAHGQTVSRVRYQASTAPFGGSCTVETQTRTCSDGTWSAWSGSFSEERCEVAAPLSCDGTAHGQLESRVSYQVASVAFGQTCKSEAQTRKCANGVWSSWSGTFHFDACTVAQPRECEGSAHGQEKTRVRFLAASVAFGLSCQAQTQRSTCNDGSWSAWSGTYMAEGCVVAAPRSCDGTPHGQAVTRVQFQAPAVPYGESCLSETQQRTCGNGAWSSWSGTFTAKSCVVEPAEPGFHYPAQVAYDGAGSLYVSDGTQGHTLRKIVLASGKVSTVKGIEGGSMAHDGAGSLFVADHTAIRKVTPATGTQTILAGHPDLAGDDDSSDGTGKTARFTWLSAAALDGHGRLFVADGTTIRQVELSTGAVTTLAGTAGVTGNSDSTDGTGQTATFHSPSGLACDGAGNLYVTDTYNYKIRKVVIATGKVTTLAGALFAALQDSTDGTGKTAGFIQPLGISFDGAQHLLVADDGMIRRVHVSTGMVTTLPRIRRVGNQDSADCPGSAAMFASTHGTVYDGAGNLYVVDEGNDSIRKVVIATSEVSTVAGRRGTSGCIDSTDGTGKTARFDNPQGLTFADQSLFVADGNTLRKVASQTGAVTTLAGVGGAPGSQDSTDGRGGSARFYWPAGVTSDGAGNLYVADHIGDRIRKVVLATGETTTLAGGSFEVGRDGTGPDAGFAVPYALAYDGAGKLFVTDALAHTIRQVVIATKVVTSLAGSSGLAGSANGKGLQARFSHPEGIAADGHGNLFVADSGNHTIRKIVIATGDVSTLAGMAELQGSDDSSDGASARFAHPAGLVLDGTGNLYVVDSWNHTVRQVDVATGEVSTLAGLAQTWGNDDGKGASARSYYPTGITLDGAGNLFVSDSVNNSIRKVDIDTGTVTTLAGAVATSP